VAQYLVVDATGTVVNVIEWDGVTPYSPEHGMTHVQHDTAGIGWTTDDGVNFTPPPPTIPDLPK
jgi:hypothetical protein